jgi:Putative adhesin
MSTTYCCARPFTRALALALFVAAAPWPLAQAKEHFREVRDADTKGTVEILDIAGKIDVSGWDQPRIEVTSDDDLADRVHITSSGSRTVIEARPTTGLVLGDDSMHLTIHVPAQSAVSANLVSADLKVRGIDGEANLRTVSGDISGDVGGNLRANTATGWIRMAARAANSIEVKTISGDVELKGGSGEVDFNTVSGDAKIELGTLTRGHFKSISGDLAIRLALAPDAELEDESVSGSVHVDFSSVPAAVFDIQSFSGDIDNCFGPKPEKPRYGPGSRLGFKSGDGKARVWIETKSGDVRICAAGAHKDST